jgi:thiol-disulfide isomerase/thioredoxin
VPVLIPALLIVSPILFLWLLQTGIKRYLSHAAQNAKIIERDPLLTDLQVGKPAIVYFTAPNCGPCRTTQKPILQQLEREEGENLQILTINIEEKLNDALRWGVMKVPRTFVLDHNLRTYATNMSIATLPRLKQQIAEAEQAAELPIESIKFVN